MKPITRRSTLLPLFALLASLCLAAPASAGEPMDVVQKAMDKTLSILTNPDYSDSEQRSRIKNVADEYFDYVELSRRTLARHWNRLDMEQKKEFVHLYRDLLAKTYLDNITGYSDETVVYGREIPLDDDQTEVRTTIRTASKDVPVFYRLINRKDAWKVYDIKVEGVSLVQNYRSQFNDILVDKSPDEMLADLRQKVAKDKAEAQ